MKVIADCNSEAEMYNEIIQLLGCSFLLQTFCLVGGGGCGIPIITESAKGTSNSAGKWEWLRTSGCSNYVQNYRRGHQSLASETKPFITPRSSPLAPTL